MSDHYLSNCPHCYAALPAGALVCPTCRQLVYQARLVQLFQEAQRMEALDPMMASRIWWQCLALLPPQSMEYQQIAQRAAMLSGAPPGGGTAAGPARPVPLNYAPPAQKSETWQSVLLKTGGSMALSIYIYSMRDGWPFAFGFVLLILIHELGHVVANWHYRLKQSPPLFLPYVGALIILRQNPPDAKAEAVVGIAGPIAGTFGSLCCYALYLSIGHPLLWNLSMWGFAMNLFNLIPIWPLDGGRVAAGITPVLWIPGALAFAGVLLVLGGYRSIASILIALFVFQSTVPRIRDVVFRGGMNSPYYRIGAGPRLAIIASYVLLGALLVVMLLPALLPLLTA